MVGDIEEMRQEMVCMQQQIKTGLGDGDVEDYDGQEWSKRSGK